MKHSLSLYELTPQEYRRLIFPSMLAMLVILMVFLIKLWMETDTSAPTWPWLILTTAVTAIYLTAYSFYLIPIRKNREAIIWLNACIIGAILWLLSSLTPPRMSAYSSLLLFATVTFVSIFSGRAPTLALILLASVPHLFQQAAIAHPFTEWTRLIGIPAAAILLNETIARILNIARQQVRRLEIINAFSRHVASTLDRDHILFHLDRTIASALVCDSYYVSVVEEGEVRLLLCYDEGEYFHNICVPAEGTLTNWVVQNQKELFLPDLRQPIEIEGIKIVLAGKDKLSLSWIGVPMTSKSFKGVLALASYQPNAFNRGDMELLSSLAQHAALALDNAARHAEVEERSRHDSLTGVLNHGYFLETLRQQAEQALANGAPLSLIMLDVDHFKEYNDTYGHLVGDRVLTALCETIRRHIKNSDAVGRWGGEEFAISLPNANAAQARAVAERIRASMRSIVLRDRDDKTILLPTVSQGIALFPAETDDINKLIDLADQRLYIAKSRGRDQLEAPHSILVP